MPVYGIERGDVLLSLQLVLTWEEESRPGLPEVPAPATPRSVPHAGNGSAHSGRAQGNGSRHQIVSPGESRWVTRSGTSQPASFRHCRPIVAISP